MQGKPGLSCVPESEHRGWTSWLDHGDQKMAVNKSDIAKVQAAVAQSLREHSGLFLTEGIILLVLGIAAIILPQFATLAVEILIGWVLLASGVVGLISSFRMRRAPGFG